MNLHFCDILRVFVRKAFDINGVNAINQNTRVILKSGAHIDGYTTQTWLCYWGHVLKIKFTVSDQVMNLVCLADMFVAMDLTDILEYLKKKINTSDAHYHVIHVSLDVAMYMYSHKV